MERIAARPAATNHARSDSVQSAALPRHCPEAQRDDDRASVRLDRQAIGAPGNLDEERSGWVLRVSPAQVDGLADAGERFQGEPGRLADNRARERSLGCSKASHLM